jgi:Dyp-type peroxidase family
MPPAIDRADIQGDVLHAYGNRYARTSYLLVGIPDVARGRRWLGGVLDRVTTDAPWNGKPPESTLNVALTSAGLAALGVPDALGATFSDEFGQGMAARAGVLGDTGISARDHWAGGLGTGAAHALLTVNALGEEALQRAVAGVEGGLAAEGLTVVHRVDAALLEGVREHFGYTDGFAQPAIEGVSEERAAGGGVPTEGGGWRPLALGEFLLGHEDEESRVDPRRRLPSAPSDPLGRNGTYMVWRKLRQHVGEFRAMLDAAARLAPGGREEVAARIVGRWRDGSPLMDFPDTQAPAFDAAAPGANDFRYGSDPGGRRCPLGAHIRRSNPRDALGFEGRLTFRHRMIRRGMPYGPPLPEDAREDDGHERGLVFVCFVASISRQFESVQRQWLADGNAFHVGRDSDFLLGGTGMVVQGDPPFFLPPQGPFVTTRGGEYLFVPGIAALTAIAEGVTSAVTPPRAAAR